MSLLHGVIARVRSLVGRRTMERRMDAEFQFHLEMETEENIRRGLSPAEARRQARLTFGAVQQHREAMREGRGLALVRELWGDTRLSLRMFRREPVLALSVVLTLALAIGATTAVFTLVRRAVLDPLPYPRSPELVSLATRYAGWGSDFGALSEPEVLDLAALRPVFSEVAAYRQGPLDLARDDESQAERVRGLHATASLFPVLRIAPDLGRAYSPEEDAPGGAPVVLLGSRLWRRLGADSGIVGREIRLNAEPHRVLGVLPPEFEFADADVVVPLRLDRAQPRSRGGHYLGAVGRLVEGVTPEQSFSFLATVSARLRQDFPRNYTPDMQWSLVSRPLRDAVFGDVGAVLAILAGAVVLVLLIGCANVANLLLARQSRREREVALRTALGAGRGRLIRQLLTEGLVLALIGTAAGLIIATLGTNLLLGLSPGAIPRVDRLGLDPGMLVTATVLAGGATLLFGIVPALRGTRVGFGPGWNARGTSAEGWGGGSRGFMAGLVSAETALAMMVVVSAGLLLRSYARLARVDLGFASTGVLAFDVTLPGRSYDTSEKITGFYQRLLGRLEQLPGVAHAGGILSLPLRSGTGSLDIEVDGRPPQPGRTSPSPNFQVVTPGYFEAMSIPLVQGRLPLPSDDARAPVVAWVNQAAAARLWPGESPLGRRFRFAGNPENAWVTVAGVVGDVRTIAAGAEPVWEYFLAHAQLPGVLDISDFHRGLSIVLGGAAEPAALARPARQVMAELDPWVAPAQMETMAAVTSRAIGRPRLVATLLGAFGVLAALLAMVGIYGVLSYAVTRRTREIGIRMALGARRPQVVRLLMGQGLNAAGLGIAIGTVAAFAAGRVTASALFGVSPRDPLVFVISAAGLSAVALAAGLIPARRAVRVQPADTLRQD